MTFIVCTHTIPMLNTIIMHFLLGFGADCNDNIDNYSLTVMLFLYGHHCQYRYITFYIHSRHWLPWLLPSCHGWITWIRSRTMVHAWSGRFILIRRINIFFSIKTHPSYAWICNSIKCRPIVSDFYLNIFKRLKYFSFVLLSLRDG